MDFPIFFSLPSRLTPLSAWHEHIPFAMFLVDVLKPEAFVELGTHCGDSYCAFCQAVEALKLNARCYAVDTWRGDAHAGFYGPEILEDLRAHHDPLYGGFSSLMQSTFDEALTHFADGTVDLLHIDGCHSYEAVKHDFESWLPKLSRRGVVLFHDTNVRERDFGVWRLWDELKRLYPHFEFVHGHGLGVLGVGKDQPKRLRELFECSDEQVGRTRDLFSRLGQRLTFQVQSEEQKESLRRQVAEKESAVQELRTSLAQRDKAARNLESTLSQIQNSHGWRFLQYYYRLRDKLLPEGSHRKNWIKFVWRVARRQPVSTPKLSLFSVANFRKYLSYCRSSGLKNAARLAFRRVQYPNASAKKGQLAVPVAGAHHQASQFTQALFERERGKKGWNTEYVPRATDYLDSRKLDIKTIAFYLPQFHPIPENDKWWGKGFTEWTNVTRAVPQFLDHYQPRLPGDLGFYDLRLPEVMRQQVEIASQYGVFGFCFHYYWFDGKKLLERPLNHFLSDRSLDIRFCVCWANENWTRRWDGLDQDILIAQHHSPDGDRAFIESLLPVFQDSRYIKIEGKPVLLVYRIDLLPSAVDTVQGWRDAVRKHGFADLYVVAARSFGISNLQHYDVDATVEFPPHQVFGMDITESRTIINPEFKGRIYDYSEYANRYARREWDDVLTFKTVMPSWDNEARRPGTSDIFYGSTPVAYARWLRDACEMTMRHQPNERLLFVNAWNEWAEGAYLEPDSRFGYGYLHATANILRYYYRDEPVATFIKACNRRFTKKKDVAIILHCYHEELVPEMIDRYVQPHAENTDLFVTLRPDATLDCVKYIQRAVQNVFFIQEENRGRDVRPFLLALRQLAAMGYAYGCKIHTKKSPHRDDGEGWRDRLTNSLLGAASSVCEARNLFSKKDPLGILSPVGSTTDLSVPDINQNNRIWLDNLLTKLGRHDLAGSYQLTFPAGSMYWFRVAALAGLDSVVFPEDAFELEVGQLDGTLAHAIERLISLYASTRGYHTEEADLGSDSRSLKAHHVVVAR